MSVGLSKRQCDRVRSLFESLFEDRDELGAALSVWHRGEEVLSLCHGWLSREQEAQFEMDTLVPVFSASKAPSAAVLCEALASGNIDFDEDVRRCWPELGEGTFRQVLSHQLGLPYLSTAVQAADREGVERDLEEQVRHNRRAWLPGARHGYHPRTSGYLWEGLVRRLTGATLQQRWREGWRLGRDIDLWIGFEPSEQGMLAGRVAQVYPGRYAIRAEERPFYRAFMQKGSISHRAFSTPKGFDGVGEMNRAEVQQAGYAAFGGLASARGLGAFYASLLDRAPFQLPERAWVEGGDAVLQITTAFAQGMMFDPLMRDPRFASAVDGVGDKERQVFGPSCSAFGHPGAGGSLGFCDPEHGLAVGFVRNQLELGILPGERIRTMINALYESGS